jgi:hypothetical protein
MIGPTELMILIFLVLPVLLVVVLGLLLWKLLKRSNRISELEGRVERLERQVDRTSDPLR